jgi:predicted metalloprotease with PDZ domain
MTTVRVLRCSFLLWWLVTATSACLAQCELPVSATHEVLKYTFVPEATDGKLVFHVALSFKGAHNGKREIVLPSTWAGGAGLEGQVRNLKAISEDTTILSGPKPDFRIVRFPSKAVVKIGYDLVKGWTGPFHHPKEFRAILEPSYFEFNADAALVHPHLSDGQFVDVIFDWQEVSTDWSVATSFGEGDRCQSFSGPWYKVNEAVFAGGDFRIHRFSLAGQTQVFAFRGKWKFTDMELIQVIQKVLSVEKDFWWDNDFPYYLVTLAPFDDLTGSTDGTCFTNAFWMFMPQNETISYTIQYTLTHEIFHTWNPHKMGIPSSPESPEKWFTEGFTVYYGDVMLVRAGLISLSDYLWRLNSKIASYELSTVKNISNSEMVARYDESREVNNLPYVRGPILALWLDARIRADSGGKQSLDTFMLQMTADSASNPDLRLTNQRIFQTTAKFLSPRGQKELLTLMESGKNIPIPPFPQSGCVALSNDLLGTYELGFDREALDKKSVIEGVLPESAAYKAGVRDGQKVLGDSIYWNDMNKPVQLEVSTSDGVKTIEYLPKGKAALIPQYHLNSAQGCPSAK